MHEWKEKNVNMPVFSRLWLSTLKGLLCNVSSLHIWNIRSWSHSFPPFLLCLFNAGKDILEVTWRVSSDAMPNFWCPLSRWTLCVCVCVDIFGSALLNIVTLNGCCCKILHNNGEFPTLTWKEKEWRFERCVLVLMSDCCVAAAAAASVRLDVSNVVWFQMSDK